MTVIDRIAHVYAAGSARELTRRYDLWADHYDQDLVDVLGYRGPRKAADVLSAYVPQDGRILDAGAGTGLVGQALYDAGYRHLVGVDLSPSMLAHARRKGVYASLHRWDLSRPLPCCDGSFDAVVCVGVFTYGHVQADCLPELLRVTRSGGHLAFSLRPEFYECSRFKAVLASLESAGRWTLLQAGPDFRCFALGGSDVAMKLWAYKKT